MLNYDKDRVKYQVVYDNNYGITNLDELLKVESERSYARFMQFRI